MGRPGPEAVLLEKMRKAARKEFGRERMTDVKYHGGPYSEAGVSDMLVCLDGVFVAVEVKAPESYPVNGQPSVERALAEGPTRKQRLFVEKVRAAGGVAGFAATVEGYLELLREAERRAQ